MSVMTQNKSWYIFFRPFGELIKLALKDCERKAQAKAIESELLNALQGGDYRGLTPLTRQACIKLFNNQRWEFPPELKPELRHKPTQIFTFWDAVQLYTKDPSFQNLSQKVRYRSKFVHLTKFFKKNRPVKGIWISDIKLYCTQRKSEGAKNATINRELSCLRSIFRTLIEHQIVETNPCKLVSKLSEKDSERQVYISYQDFNKIVSFTPEQHQDFFWILYLTGLRRGEAFKLHWKHIDLNSRIILFHSTETKESNFKRVPIHRDLMPRLKRMQKVRLFGDDKIWTMGYHSPSESWKNALSKLDWGNPRPRINDLRHTFKTNCRRSKIDEEIRESFMGHVDRKRNVAHRYGFIDDSELVEAIDQFTYDHGLTQILATARAQK